MALKATLAPVTIAAVLVVPARAVDVYYDVEGDSGTTVTDKLATDGANDGTLQNSVTFEGAAVPFGAQALRFAVAPAPPTLDQYTNLELPETMDLGTAFTLSAFVDFSNAGLTRLFSNYGGTGSTAGRVLLDLNKGSATGLRFIVDGQSRTNVTDLTPIFANPGYHHVAATYDDGVGALYIDGVDMGLSSAFPGGIMVTATQNLRFGEDPHDAGGAANEQFNGHVDDLLVVNRALSAGEIASIVSTGVGSGYTSGAETRAIHYSFEGDSGTSITDKLIADGAQDAIAHQMAAVDANATAAAFGSQSGLLTPVPTVNLTPLSRINLGALGNLGDTVTMAAVVNMDSPGQVGGKLARIFSTYAGSGSTAGKLIFDADPNAANIVSGSPLGVRVILPDGTQARASDTFTTGDDHLFAFTYDHGELKLYLDGVEIASSTSAGAGPIDLGAFSLFVGEDSAGGVNEQLVGVVDDVLILSRALSAAEMVQLRNLGAEQFLAVPEPASGMLATAAAAAAVLLCRRRRRNEPA